PPRESRNTIHRWTGPAAVGAVHVFVVEVAGSFSSRPVRSFANWPAVANHETRMDSRWSMSVCVGISNTGKVSTESGAHEASNSTVAPRGIESRATGWLPMRATSGSSVGLLFGWYRILYSIETSTGAFARLHVMRSRPNAVTSPMLTS